ncbi:MULTISPECIES: hypothetical protein [unclassified Spirosoma]|uniref:hypothetical protein n=1 Tax=unclassified Spirosoma TaxID=2621999 RepID=UPI00095F233E|nr:MULTISPECIES: hypothetical protein [unclassified Spirosoma]MBN8824259.1 hypothetical protein [Spirosoma sp.]OJW78989.1 MAG: hypothetical protein BGO59_11040 [Spirosoma sp. 48-14]
MERKPIIDRIEHEVQALQGDATKDVSYSSERTFASEAEAQVAFRLAVSKLLNVNGWSGLSSLTADFQLYDTNGQPKPNGHPQVGDYIRVALPGPMPENWVHVRDFSSTENRVEFTVNPSHDPHESTGQIEHFFHKEAQSTFRVELTGKTITASEIGRQEGINNQQPEAGNRAAINTVIAETGWLFYQKFQWKQLTDYLVGL